MNDTKTKVLVVDDNENYLQLIEMALAGEHNVVTACDGQEGIEKARKEKPDIILLDVMMPRVSGLEMLHMLVADNELCRIPVIVMTANQFDPATEMTFKAETNVKTFLRKPCPADRLKIEILDNLGKK